MNKAERDRIEAALPRDRAYRMPPEMSKAMRAAAWEKFATLVRGGGKDERVNWEQICVIFCAAFEAQEPK